MKRSETTDNSGLEMLLDTICNTFGGILLISLLLIVILQFTGGQAAVALPDEMSQAEFEMWKGRLDISLAELERLKTFLEEQEKTNEQFGGEELAELIEKLREAHSDNLQAQRTKGELVDDLADSQGAINEILGRYNDVTNRVKAARDDAARERSSKATVRITEKKSAAILLREGRLCLVYKGADGNYELNREQVVETVDGTGTFLEPKRGAGLLVDNSGGNSQQIDALLRQYDPSQCYLDIVVWQDSFEEFVAIKKRARELGFEYRLVLLEDQEKVKLADDVPPREVIAPE